MTRLQDECGFIRNALMRLEQAEGYGASAQCIKGLLGVLEARVHSIRVDYVRGRAAAKMERSGGVVLDSGQMHCGTPAVLKTGRIMSEEASALARNRLRELKAMGDKEVQAPCVEGTPGSFWAPVGSPTWCKLRDSMDGAANALRESMEGPGSGPESQEWLNVRVKGEWKDPEAKETPPKRGIWGRIIDRTSHLFP